MIADKIQQNLIAALKAKDEVTLSTLRFLQSALKNKQIEKRKDLTDEEVIGVIRKQVKELTEAAEMFKKGGRQDLVGQNEKQITVLKAYLPAEISDEELKSEIEKIIAKNKETYEKNPKAIIGIVMGALKSKADPKRIMEILNQAIS